MKLDGVDPKHLTGTFKPKRSHLTTDVQQLRAKWEREGYYFGVGRKDLRHAEQQLGLPLGTCIERAAEIREETRELFHQHREHFRTAKGTFGDRLEALKAKLR